MSNTSGTIHVVSKQDNSQHASIDMPAGSLPDLNPSSVRVKINLIGLTSTNLTYAFRGGIFKWWDAYPVPSSAPAPYNDSSKWGIVPAWGYATIMQSNISSLPTGTVLFGFWPTSSYPVDLQLSSWIGEQTGFYVEGSPHRSNLMDIYKRYRAFPQGTEFDELYPFNPLWSCGWALSTATFGKHAIHPLSLEGWTVQDADLSEAIVVLVSAASKTARSIAWHLVRNREKGSGPLGLLLVTSVPEELAKFRESDVKVKAVSYDKHFPADWAKVLNAKKAVIIDMGGRDGALQKAYDGVSQVTTSTTVLAVGGEAKIVTESVPSEIRAGDGSTVQKVPVNTSGILTDMEKVMGFENYVRDYDDAWKRFTAENGFGPLDIKHYNGVDGTTGIEGAWEGYVKRTHKASGGIVVRL